MRKFCLPAAALLVLILIATTCARQYGFRRSYSRANALLHDSQNLAAKPFLKAHLRNGNIGILRDSWQVDTIYRHLEGIGDLYDFNRHLLKQGPLLIDLDSVSIFETNTKLTGSENERISALSILAGLDVVLGIFCLTTPKACFGSCPTFYLGSDENVFHSDAEGFSNSIAPSLEASDIDALDNGRIVSRKISLKMKNEAMETHVVRDVKVYAVPRSGGQMVFHTPQNQFFRCCRPLPLQSALADEGDCTALLEKADKNERFSLADPENLKSREEIVLSFGAANLDRAGLAIGFRQTLMTTYLIYSAFGYMGDEMGSIFAELEKRSGPQKDLGGIRRELGDIEVFLWDQSTDRWLKQGGFYETGPIAINHQLLPFTKSLSGFEDDIKVKLVLNRGLWRIDYLALAGIIEQVEPLVLAPEKIEYIKTGEEPSLSPSVSLDKPIVSMPGDIRSFEFTLPEAGGDYELFLYSRGYYLEWMRSSWIKEKDLGRLARMLLVPGLYLKEEAADYKRYETVMEREFWGTRIDNRMFSYYEKR
jgi:hypothetical protein